MLAEALAGLASAGSTALVSAMVTDGWEDVVHGDQIWGVRQVEQQAHYFAAAFLMPADDIAHELPTRADWPKLFDLKRK